jgi:muconolactone delta-isomerase
MKYLILQKPFQVPSPPEAMKATAQALEASMRIFDDLKAKGKCDLVYSFAGISGGVAIVDLDSPEELDQLVMQTPISAFGQIEVYPLVDLKNSLEALKKVIAQIG